MEQFDPAVERLDDYKERFDFYCVANGIGNDRKKALFLTKIGQRMFANLKVWVSPTSLSDLSFDDIITRLRARTVPQTVEIAERYRFFKCAQKGEESVIDFMSQLRALAKTCNFGNYLEIALRDQFVCGLQDSRIQRELLCVRDLTLEQALDKARSIEIVLKETASLQQRSTKVEGGKGEEVADVLKVTTKQGPRKGCFRCGGNNHVADHCFHKEKECNVCGKVGHLARVCRMKKSKKGMMTHMVGAMEEQDRKSEDSETDDEMYVHKIGSNVRHKKLVTKLRVNNAEIKFEVDTGAELSLIPFKTYKEKLAMITLHPSSVVLRLYDGSVLPTKGEVLVEVKQGSQQATGRFVVVENADFQLPLLGRDWLGKLRLNWQELFQYCKTGDPRVNALYTADWINKFPDVVKDGLGRLKGIVADIELKGKVKPVFCKCRAIPFALRKQVEEMLQQQVQDGELQPVEQSEWAAPIVVIKKKDGGIRVCADFKMTINPYLQHKTFPLPTPEEIFATLAGGESFTKIDLARAYKQMEVALASQPLLTITTHMGLFRYQRLPFGVATAPAMWQRAMSIVFQGCKRTVYYMDDILVTGATRKEHEANLCQVFERLQQYGLRVNLSKCRFFQHTVEFLGHSISPIGIQPTDERVKGVVEAPIPTNKTELKSFLGLMTYNAKFLPQLATVLHPLYQLLCKDVKWKWTKVHDIAVKEAKALVCKSPILAHFDTSKPIKLYCDASAVGIGACLMHVIGGQEQPVMYASRSLSKTEAKYAQIEREALAIIFAIKKFHQYLYGKEFILVTDHKPLCKLFGHMDGIPSLAAARIQRWALLLSAYQYRIEYVPGSENYCADCMSRLPLPIGGGEDKDTKEASILAVECCTLPVTAHDIAKATRRDKMLAAVLQSVLHGRWNMSSHDLDPFYRRRDELSCHDGCVLWGQRVIIPAKLQSALLDELHDGHLGVVRMKELARSYIWWPYLDRDIEKLVANCEKCRMMSSMPQLAPHHPWQYLSSPWERVHIDYGEHKGIHFLVLVDAYSKWPEVRQVSTTTSQQTVEVLEEIFAMHGFPRTLVSDNGPQFSSAEFAAYLTSHHILHRTSAPYHPATNGLAENMVKNVKQWLDKQAKGFRFSRALSEFLRTYRNVPHTVTKRTPAEIIFGRALRTHLSMVLPNMTERVKRRSEHDGNTSSRTFSVGDRVWVRDFRPSAVHKWIQGEITVIIGAMCYEVILADGHKRKVHVDHLKQATHAPQMPVLPVAISTQVPGSGIVSSQSNTRCELRNTAERRDEGNEGREQDQLMSQPCLQQTPITVSVPVEDETTRREHRSQEGVESTTSNGMSVRAPEVSVDASSNLGSGGTMLPCRRSTRISKAPKRFSEEFT
eukprot:Em0003g242a